MVTLSCLEGVFLDTLHSPGNISTAELKNSGLAQAQPFTINYTERFLVFNIKDTELSKKEIQKKEIGTKI